MKNEDRVTSTVEEQTKQIPSVTFLGLAGGAMIASAALIFMGRDRWSMFVGQWVPTLLILGTYNKIAKTFSADRRGERSAEAAPTTPDFAEGISDYERRPESAPVITS